MPIVVVMPKLGLTMTEGRIGRWLKKPGDPVQAGEPVLEVETEKLTVEVEAPGSGILTHVLADEGTTLPVAAPVAVIAGEGEEVDLPSLLAQQVSTPTRASPSITQPAPSPPTPTVAVRAPIRATPAARKLAQDHGIDLSRVTGTGPGGRITAEDVERYLLSHATPWPRGEPVRFWSDGFALSGELYFPPAPHGEPRPAIVLCTGIQGIKELGMPLLAQQLAQAGYISLIFDYRGFGSSEGPRGRLLPTEQIRDVRAALSFLETHPAVEKRALAVLGLSLGGAHALSTAAVDKRVRVCIALAPVTNGQRWLRSLRAEWQWRLFLQDIAADRQERVRSGISRSIPLFTLMPPDPETEITLRELAKRFPNLPTEPTLTLESAEALLDYSPEREVAQIAPRALLLIHGEDDVLVSPEESLAAWQRAGDPKRLVLLTGMGHFNWLNSQHPIFQRILREITDWLAHWLASSRGEVIGEVYHGTLT